MKLKKSTSLELVKLCCRALDDKKAGDLRVLDVSEQSSITDYLILATATSEPHLRSMRVEMEKTFDTARSRIVGIESAHESGWVVVDAFDIMVHLFLSDRRNHYGLENLWKDAIDVSVPKLLAIKATKPAKKKVASVSKRKPLRK